jgi:hypothetical protein
MNPAVRNPITWRERVSALRGEPIDFDLRDGAHLARLGGRDPLSIYTTAATESFARFFRWRKKAGAPT